MTNYDEATSIKVVFEPADQGYYADIYGVAQGSAHPGVRTVVQTGDEASIQYYSGAAAYYTVLIPSGGAKAISGVSTFSTDVTFTMGVMLTVFHD